MKNNKLEKISDSMQFVECYHCIMMSGEAFSRLSVNIPKALLPVVQNIHQRYDNAAYHAFKASNSNDIDEKMKDIREAKNDIFFQYNSFEYLVKTKGITIGAANDCLLKLKDCYEQLDKWYKYLIKQK